MKKKFAAFLVAAVMTLGLGAVTLSGCGTAELVYTLSDDETHYIVSVSGTATALTEADILDEYEGLPVTEIASMGFYSCRNLKSIVIPDSITTIGASAFTYCTKLSSVTLSNNLEIIPYGIFGNCDSLKTIEIPASVKKIAYGAFAYSYITSITIPETVQELGTYCFYECENLETVDIRCEVSVIPYGLCYNCTNLTTVYLPASVTEIKGDETVEITNDEGETEEATYYGAFSYGYISAVSQTIIFDFELEYIYFRGTEEQWNAVIVGENPGITENTQVVCNYTD